VHLDDPIPKSDFPILCSVGITSPLSVIIL
jgi:hypothetical protein